MKKIVIILAVWGLPLIASAQNYQIDWYVIGSGGGTSSSANYQMSGTIGQPIIGHSSSANYQLDAGFWVGAAPEGPVGCDYRVGDINNNGATNGIDVTYGVSYLKGGAPPPINCYPNCPAQPNPFYAAMDVNGNCAANGIDITYFVSYLKGGAALRNCPDCPPAGGYVPPAPAVMPITAPVLNVKPAIKQSN